MTPGSTHDLWYILCNGEDVGVMCAMPAPLWDSVGAYHECVWRYDCEEAPDGRLSRDSYCARA